MNVFRFFGYLLSFLNFLCKVFINPPSFRSKVSRTDSITHNLVKEIEADAKVHGDDRRTLVQAENDEGDLAENLGYFYQIETASRIRFTQLNQLSSQPQSPGSYYKPVPFTLLATGTSTDRPSDHLLSP